MCLTQFFYRVINFCRCDEATICRYHQVVRRISAKFRSETVKFENEMIILTPNLPWLGAKCSYRSEISWLRKFARSYDETSFRVVLARILFVVSILHKPVIEDVHRWMSRHLQVGRHTGMYRYGYLVLLVKSLLPVYSASIVKLSTGFVTHRTRADVILSYVSAIFFIFSQLS